MNSPARPLVVFGGGALGGAVARLAAGRGVPVIVASRRMGDHPGWWRPTDVGSTEPVQWLPSKADVVVAISPGPREAPERAWGARLSEWLDRLQGLRPASVLLAGPAGEGDGGLDTFCETAWRAGQAGIAVLRFPALLAMDHHWAGGIAATLRSGRAARVSSSLPTARALAADDAARAVLACLGSNDDLLLTGPDRVEPEAVLEALAERFGIEPKTSIFAARLDRNTRARLDAQARFADRWDDARFGARLSVQEWAARLPGPRRRRGTFPT